MWCILNTFINAGLSDTLIEAGIVAASSVFVALEGRPYNKVLQAHKIVKEAMQRLRLKSFQEWMKENERSEYEAVREELDRVCRNPCAETFTAMLMSDGVRRLLDLWCILSNQQRKAGCLLGLIHICDLFVAEIHTSNTRGSLESAPELHSRDAAMGLCIQQDQLCSVPVSPLVWDGTATTDPPQCQWLTWGWPLFSPTQPQQCIYSSTCGPDDWTNTQ